MKFLKLSSFLLALIFNASTFVSHAAQSSVAQKSAQEKNRAAQERSKIAQEHSRAAQTTQLKNSSLSHSTIVTYLPDEIYNEILTGLSMSHPGSRVKVSQDINRNPSVIEFVSAKDELWGVLRVRCKNDVITISKIEVTPALRGKKISELLMARALMEAPNTHRIVTDALTQDNRQIFLDGIKAGMTPRDALKNTPAYKMRVKFGFTEIDEKKSKYDPKDPQNIYFETTKPQGDYSAQSSASSEASQTPVAETKPTPAQPQTTKQKAMNQVRKVVNPDKLKEKLNFEPPKLPGW